MALVSAFRSIFVSLIIISVNNTFGLPASREHAHQTEAVTRNQPKSLTKFNKIHNMFSILSQMVWYNNQQRRIAERNLIQEKPLNSFAPPRRRTQNNNLIRSPKVVEPVKNMPMKSMPVKNMPVKLKTAKPHVKPIETVKMPVKSVKQRKTSPSALNIPKKKKRKATQYIMIRALPKTQSQLNFLISLWKKGSKFWLQFWRHPSGVNEHVDMWTTRRYYYFYYFLLFLIYILNI